MSSQKNLNDNSFRNNFLYNRNSFSSDFKLTPTPKAEKSYTISSPLDLSNHSNNNSTNSFTINENCFHYQYFEKILLKPKKIFSNENLKYFKELNNEIEESCFYPKNENEFDNKYILKEENNYGEFYLNYKEEKENDDDLVILNFLEKKKKQLNNF